MVQSVPLTAFAFLLHGLPIVNAWGAFGHETIAYIAQDFVSASAKEFAQDILGSTSSSYLASVSTWADSYRSTTAGKFSSAFHYIDAQDSPPSSCNVDYDRDCTSSGCVVSAIANYTERVQETSLSSTERQNALKFIVHFIGDIHQPLHDENLALGGNNIDVTFDGTSSNLHSIWDTAMPQKLADGSSLADARVWATALTAEIKSGSYASASSGWIDGMDVSDGVSSSMVWATDANSYVCTTVLPDGQAAVEDVDLGGDYFDSASPVIEELVARAGYRLAAWLNLIADGSTGLSRREAGSEALKVSFRMPSPVNGRSPTAAQLARRAMGNGCGCDHEH